MVEDIKGLIAKIQQEGVEAAEEKARTIEAEARAKAEALLAEAKEKAQALIAEGKDTLAKMEKSSRSSLEQAGRDLLLSLRAEIETMLDRLILAQVRQVLKPDDLAEIITVLLKGQSGKQPGEIVISVGEKDLSELKQALSAKLADAVKKGVTLKPAGEISAGFVISYDGGKSHYDFSDKGIAEYLSGQLKPELAEILKQAAASKGKSKKS